jgi:hypothetical protein
LNGLKITGKKNNLFWPNEEHGDGDEILISLVKKDRLIHLLNRMLNEDEFLSGGGIRALSKYHLAHPYSVTIDGTKYEIQYDPGDSTSNLFGGNSNWRGPVWMPINYLIIRSIRKYGEFYGDNFLNLVDVSNVLTGRIVSLLAVNEKGERKFNGKENWFYKKPGNENLVLFYEYFHGDSGRGLGASHQTGWTSLIADLIGVSSVKKEDWKEGSGYEIFIDDDEEEA